VVFGAFGAHLLKNILDEYKSICKSASLPMFHTMALFAVGVMQRFDKETSFSIAGWGFFIWIIVFSGSLYVMAITGIKWLGAITPIGGVAFLLGWLWMGWTLIKSHL
jgi:uncharacterized membrane protein YgdD (TMEM256/DUF423 family)